MKKRIQDAVIQRYGFEHKTTIMIFKILEIF